LKNTELSNIIKSTQWEPSCSMRSGGQTDMAKLIVAFRNSANASNITVQIKPEYAN